MNFSPKSLCEHLQKLGCVSHSGFYWVDSPDYQPGTLLWSGNYSPVDYLDNREGCIPAFVPQDFIGPTEKARENTDIIFKLGDWMADPLKHGYLCSSALRRELADSKTEAEFWAYIEEAIKEAA